MRDAAEDRVDAQEQLLRLERLAEVVVRPGLEPADAVVGLAFRGEEEDRRVDVFPERPGEADPVLARHHHVEDDEVEFEPAEKPPGMRRVARGRDEKAVPDQELLEKPRMRSSSSTMRRWTSGSLIPAPSGS
jgi:hypothetical protein